MQDFDSLYSNDQSVLSTLHQLARAHRILEMEGHGDMSLGHMSYRDPEGRGMWLKRGNLGLDEVQAEDFLLVDFEGNVLEGKGILHLEWPLHSELYLARPDVNFIGHSHPFYTTAFATTTAEFGPYTNEGVWFAKDGVPRFDLTSNIITTVQLGKEHAAAMGNSLGILLSNHGCSFVGETVQDVTLGGVFLERACKFHMTLAVSGFDYRLPPQEETDFKLEEIYRPKARNNFWNYYNRRLDRLERSGRL